MATLMVLKFDQPDEAEKALETLKPMQKQELIRMRDAAVVSWPAGRKGPITRQHGPSTVGAGALGGGFWGLLLGLIFFVPLIGAAVGAAAGALMGSFTDYGINDDFIKQTREKVTEGTSALFLLAGTEAPDRVAEAIAPFEPEVIATNLSRDEEARLTELFAAE